MVELKEKIYQTITESLNLEFEVAAIKSGSVRVPGVAKNFRDPDIVDDELTALQFLSKSYQPLLTFMDFPCHPEVLWEQNPHITSDYPASLRKTVEAETNSPCIFFSGALGGMMSPDVEDHSFEEDELGYILPKEDFRYPLNPFNPKDHYEETMSISKDIGAKMMDAVDSLLRTECKA